MWGPWPHASPYSCNGTESLVVLKEATSGVCQPDHTTEIARVQRRSSSGPRSICMVCPRAKCKVQAQDAITGCTRSMCMVGPRAKCKVQAQDALA